MPTTPTNSTCVRSRSDTTANWTAANPILLQGEWAHDVTTGCVRIGNGVSRWSDLCDFCPDCGSPPPPPPPTGACCFGTACTPGMTQAACQAAGGVWKGAGTTCVSNPCVEAPPPPGSGSGSGSGSGGLNCGSICEVVYSCENGTTLFVHHFPDATVQECHQLWIDARNAWTENPGTVPNGSLCDTPTPPTVSYRAPDGCDLCGVRASFEGQRGVHEFLIDLEDKSGFMGVWFNAESVPDRFSLHWPLTVDKLEQAALPEYTSGWRGKVDGGASEAAITALSGASPYLRYPKSHGPISGTNGPRPIVAREVLGDARQNENWGYFTFYRSPAQAASGEGRYARLVVEAPIEDTKWYCGLICDVPLSQPICWEKVGPVSRFPVPAGQTPPFWVSGCDVGVVDSQLSLQGPGWIAPTGPVRTGDGSTPYVYFGVNWNPGAHDWKASVDTGVDDDPVYGTLASKMRDEIVESLYHPLTGFWVHTKQRLCGISAAGNPSAEPTSSLGCHVSGFDYSSGSQATAIDPGGTLGTVDVGAGEATGGTEPPRGPGGVG